MHVGSSRVAARAGTGRPEVALLAELDATALRCRKFAIFGNPTGYFTTAIPEGHGGHGSLETRADALVVRYPRAAHSCRTLSHPGSDDVVDCSTDHDPIPDAFESDVLRGVRRCNQFSQTSQENPAGISQFTCAT